MIPWMPLMLAVVLSLVSSKAAEASTEPAPPNILMIVSDDQGWGDFGFMGHPIIKTPHLDALAAQSAVFPNGYVPTSLCRASLATLLTGLYPSQHRICCNDPPEGQAREAMHPFMRSAPALPRLLGAKGYGSLQTGKFWEGHFSNAGFTHGMTVKGRHGDTGLAIGRETLEPIRSFLRSHREKPFFVWYAPMMPHEPHNPPARLLEKYEAPGRAPRLAKYMAMCEWFDETCGEALAMLDEEKLSDNTLVVFVVDNGWIQVAGDKPATHGWFSDRSKRSPYEGGLRTPVMLRWPGKIPPAVHSGLVSTIDLVPTMLEAAGVDLPAKLPGSSLLPWARGADPAGRGSVYGEIYLHTAQTLADIPVNLTHRWMRQGDWKLILPAGEASQGELYDLSADPEEQKNLAGQMPARLNEMKAALREWVESHSLF